MEKRKTKKDIVKMLLRNNELDERDEEELIDLLFDQPIAIDVDKQEEAKMSFGDKVSDRVSEICGSWGFIILFIIFLAFWVILNVVILSESDGEHIEAVLMRHDYGNSICVSSQVGCNMGCKFCESGRRKKVRNLEAYEMVLQILMIEKELGERISHVVVMGIGEPFDNYDNLVKFFKIIHDPKGLAIGARHITVSTCGIVPKILEFSELDLQINLAISLHAANNETRNKIMPINKAYPLEVLIPALKTYLERTNRRVTFEYILLSGINDSEEDAIQLAKLAKGINCYINLIPYNETNNIDFKRSSTIQIMKFYDILKKNSVNVTIRREFGSKISAACGQLRSKKEEV